MQRDIDFFQAAKRENLAEMEILLDDGANINCDGDDGKTALHLAVEKGNQAMAELLLHRVADLRAVDHRGQTPHDLALGQTDFRMIDLLEIKL